MSGMLLYDVPQSEGVKNLLARAKRITQFQWTPAQEICIKRNDGGWPFIAPCQNGKTPEKPKQITGLPYSSARIANKFVGIDITFDTFLTAVQNPASIVYQRDNSEFDDPNYNCRIANTYFYYGVVCSAFADYVYDLPIHRCTYEQCTPRYLSWTEERVVCHDQTLITANDLKRGFSETYVRKAFDNNFANLLLYSVNDFGTTCTAPITFVLD